MFDTNMPIDPVAETDYNKIENKMDVKLMLRHQIPLWILMPTDYKFFEGLYRR